MKTKMKFILSKSYLFVLMVCLMSLISLRSIADPPCSLCATPSSTGIENCCDAWSEPTLCAACTLATVFAGETIDFRHVSWPYPMPNPNDQGCSPTYWAIYTSCSVWTPGALYMPMFTTSTSVFSLNTSGWPAGTYYIQASCLPIVNGGGGGCTTHIYQFVVLDPPPTGKCWCQCDDINMWLSDFRIDEAGVASVGFHLGNTIYNVDKLRITLINYDHNVPEDCKLCDLVNEEKFGDIWPAPYLYGTAPSYGPYNPNLSADYSREVTWCFENEVPKIDPLFMPLGLRFPPVKPGCKNNADFCFRVEVFTDGCKQCERLVCLSRINGNLNEQKLGNPNVISEPEGRIKAIPNPARNSFNLQTPEGDAIGDVSIYDTKGTLLKQLHTKSSLTLIDCKGWTPGIYVINYKTATKSYQEKLVIEK
jgi:hypothetical protein